jgi:phage tail sheath gpL-like
MPEISFDEAVGGPVPAVEIEINLGGAGGLADGSQIRDVIFIAERVAAGDGAADTISSTAFGSGDDGIAFFGSTSPGAAMVASLYDYFNSESGGPKCSVWGAAIAEKATGTAPVQTLTIVDTNTAAGVLNLRIGGKVFPISFANSTIIADQATAIRDAFNNANEKDRPPLVATAALGVVTFTGSVKCAHMNNIGLETVSKGSILTSTYVWSDTTMGGAGDTPGVGGYAGGDFTAILAALTSFTAAGQYVIPWTENGNAAAKAFDTVVPTAFRAHIIAKANATNMVPTSLRMAWKASVVDATAAVAVLDTDDSERLSLAVSPYSAVSKSGTWDGEIAARYAGLRASQRELPKPFNALKMSGVAVPNPADNWTNAEQKSLLDGACTPIAVPNFGSDMALVRDVTCRAGFGVLDTQAIDSLDFIRLDFAGALNKNPRQIIVDDGEEVPLVDYATTPGIIKSFLRSRADLLAPLGYMQKVAENWENVSVNLSGSTVQLSIPISLIPGRHNTMVRLDAAVPPGA